MTIEELRRLIAEHRDAIKASRLAIARHLSNYDAGLYTLMEFNSTLQVESDNIRHQMLQIGSLVADHEGAFLKI